MREITAMFNVLLKVVLLTSVLTSPILAEDKTIYALLGGEIVLFPEPFSGTLKRVVWKQGDDKAAEWEESPIEYYREFKGRTKLDTGTGTMTLKDLTASFSGIYLAEINGKQASKTSELRVIGRVSPPNTSKECDTKTECTLHCKGENTTDGRYAWIKDGVELPSSSSSLTVQLDGVYDSRYTCKYSNPVSSALGEPLIPFPSTHSPGTIAGIIFGVALLLAAAGGLAYKLKYKPRKKDGRAEESEALHNAIDDKGTSPNADPEKADNDDKGTSPNADPKKADNGEKEGLAKESVADPEKADNDDKGTSPNADPKKADNGPEAVNDTPL